MRTRFPSASHVVVLVFAGGALLLASSATQQEGQAPPTRGVQEARTVRLFYLPFGTQTYVPVTRETIEKDATCSFEMDTDSAEALRLRLLLERGENSGFDDRVVRLKVVGLLPNAVFVNQKGESIRGPGHAYRLSDGDFADLGALMQDLSRAHGCPASSATSGCQSLDRTPHRRNDRTNDTRYSPGDMRTWWSCGPTSRASRDRSRQAGTERQEGT